MLILCGERMSEEAVTAIRRPPDSIWRNWQFLIWWGGQTVSQLGGEISTLAIPLLVLALTGSPAQAGAVGATRLVPYLLFSFPAGALVDRWNRKWVMMVSDAVRGLALSSLPVALFLGHLTAAQLYLVAFIEGVGFTFFMTAQIASITQIVAGAHLPQAAAFSESSGSLATLVGPTLAGVIISLGKTVAIGATLGLLATGVSYLFSVASLGFIRVPLRRDATAHPVGSMRKEIWLGLRFLLGHRHLRVLALLGLDIGLLVIPSDLAVIVLARNELHLQPATIGLIFSAGGLGALIGSVVGPWVKRHFRLGRVILGTIAVEALTTTIQALSVSPLMLAAGMFGLVMMLPIYNVSQVSYRLSLIPDHLQGRVNSAFRLVPLGSQPLGLIAIGALLGVLSPRLVLGLVAGGFVLSAVLVSLTDVRRA